MSKEVTKKDLILVGKELQKVMNYDDEVSFNPKATPAVMTEWITEASADIAPTDVFSEEFIEILTNMGLWTKGTSTKKKERKETKPTTKKTKKVVVEEETEEVKEELEKTDEPEDEPEDDGLTEEIIEQIKDPDTGLDELKDIVKSYLEFKTLKNKLSNYEEGDEDELAIKMLDLLGIKLDEEEPEEPVLTKKGKTNKKETKEKSIEKKKPTNTTATKKGGIPKVGVISTIVEAIEKAGKKGISKEGILDVLKEKFPDRPEDSMKNTINIQVPYRINKEKFPLEQLKNGNYYKK
jgi:hypothetical protein